MRTPPLAKSNFLLTDRKPLERFCPRAYRSQLYSKQKAGDTFATEMAIANTNDASKDVLS